MMRTPSIGSIVVYVDEDGGRHPAVVLGGSDAEGGGGPVVDLFVFSRAGGFVNVTAVVCDPDGVTSASWHWPPRSSSRESMTP